MMNHLLQRTSSMIQNKNGSLCCGLCNTFMTHISIASINGKSKHWQTFVSYFYFLVLALFLIFTFFSQSRSLSHTYTLSFSTLFIFQIFLFLKPNKNWKILTTPVLLCVSGSLPSTSHSALSFHIKKYLLFKMIIRTIPVFFPFVPFFSTFLKSKRLVNQMYHKHIDLFTEFRVFGGNVLNVFHRKTWNKMYNGAALPTKGSKDKGR